MKEEWKDINGYKGNYQISNLGNVFNKNWGRPLKSQINKSNGYLEVHLSKKCKRTHFTIHRLVALHFVEKINGKDFVNHKDSDKYNNLYTNIEWVTKSENGIHAGKAGLISVCLRKKVDQFTSTGIFIKTHISMSEAARSLGLQKTNISTCCRGKMLYTGGFIWKFSKE